MKKLILIMISLFLFVMPTSANEKTSFYLFYGDGCPHCAKEKEWLETIKNEYHDVDFHLLETWDNEENQKLYTKVHDSYQLSQDGVPLTIIGDKYFFGFNDYTKEEIKKVLNSCQKTGCEDYISKIQKGEDVVIPKPKEVKPSTKTKTKVEVEKTFINDETLVFGIVLVLSLLIFIVLGDNMKRKKKKLETL